MCEFAWIIAADAPAWENVLKFCEISGQNWVGGIFITWIGTIMKRK